MIKRLFYTYMTPAVAGLIAVMTSAPPAIATSNTYTYVGTTGDYSGSCSIPECNNSDGCRVTANIYDTWFPDTECSGLLTEGPSTCSETFHLCRKISHYSDSLPDCGGTWLYDEFTEQAVCAHTGP